MGIPRSSEGMDYTVSDRSGAEGVCEYLTQAKNELRKAMAYTGCKDLSHMDPTIVHKGSDPS